MQHIIGLLMFHLMEHLYVLMILILISEIQNGIPENWNIDVKNRESDLFKVNLLTDTISKPNNLSAYYSIFINGQLISDYSELEISSNVFLNSSIPGILIFNEDINVNTIKLLFKYQNYESILKSINVRNNLNNEPLTFLAKESNSSVELIISHRFSNCFRITISIRKF